MADKLTVNVPIAISKAPEASLNAMKTLAAEFDGALTSAFNITLPNIEKIISDNLVGSGDEFPLSSDNDYVSHPGITFSDRVNTSLFSILAARFMSGTVTSTQVAATTAYDHVIEAQSTSADPQLKSSTVACKMGGLDLMLAGMVGNSLQIGFSGAALPTYSVEMIGSGKFAYMADQAPALVLPTPAVQDYMGSIAAINVTLNDGTLLDLGAAGRLSAFNLQASNNVVTGDRRPGDAFRTPGDILTGAFVGRLTRGVRSLSTSLSFYCDDAKREWLDHLNNTTITAFSFKMVGKKIGATIHSHEVEITIPKSVFRSYSIQDNNSKLLSTVDIQPLKDGSTTGLFKMRIRNDKTTLA